MDDMTLLTIGKLYLELTRVQRIAELQQAKIAEQEDQINKFATQKPVTK